MRLLLRRDGVKVPPAGDSLCVRRCGSAAPGARDFSCILHDCGPVPCACLVASRHGVFLGRPASSERSCCPGLLVEVPGHGPVGAERQGWRHIL